MAESRGRGGMWIAKNEYWRRYSNSGFIFEPTAEIEDTQDKEPEWPTFLRLGENEGDGRPDH